jgi:preprotein translocase subunit SecA
MKSAEKISGLPQGLAARSLAFLRGLAWQRVANWTAVLPKIEVFEQQYRERGDHELRKESLSLRYRAKSGEALARLLPEAYALVREAARRTVNMRHFDVQILGGIALFHGSIAEMETGEGKTLTATLPMYLRSLEGKGAHLATVNDYLASRDAKWMKPIYDLLGVSVGVIETEHSQNDRRKAYACDVTYGTAKEFGFDFLRDRLLLRRIHEQQSDLFGQISGAAEGRASEQPVQRGAHFVLVDEADSILIDEARTPLIIGTIGEKAREQIVACYQWAARLAPQFVEDEHYEYDHEKKKVELTAAGRQLVRALSHPEIMNTVGLITLYEYMERGIKVHRDFFLDRQYVVRDGEIVIVDEFTGRLAEGRKWRDGIHQAIEAKEAVEVTMPTGQAARITVQDLFLRYQHLAGMTGTAITAAREIRKVYKARVIPIPTNVQVNRQRLPDQIFTSSDDKWAAIVDDIRQQHEAGRPVLIGTRSIDKSEILSRMLSDVGIEHQVLNARHVATEAEIVALAGQPGKVTVATNMAGRGTDIKLDAGVAGCGGLHVICTEMHDSARIDRQLSGRCGRQGDPGTVRQYLSMDDDILRNGFGPEKAKRLAAQGTGSNGASSNLSNLFRRAQRRVEREHLRQRMMLLHHEKERKKMQLEMGQDPYLDTPD